MAQHRSLLAAEVSLATWSGLERPAGKGEEAPGEGEGGDMGRGCGCVYESVNQGQDRGGVALLSGGCGFTHEAQKPTYK